ncbi:hypothetical protein RI367_006361 [Sorochytrium milnesiophthora]
MTTTPPVHPEGSAAVADVEAGTHEEEEEATVIPPLQPNEQMDITFKDLTYEIDIMQGKVKSAKPILKGVSAKFRKGCLTVILGASGAGKTSLLNVVAGETKIGKIGGALFINGQPSTGATMKKVSGFVHQDDVVLGTMTVTEAITMSAKLRLPPTVSLAEKEKRVEEIIHMLGIYKCRNTVIGTATQKGVSGGERKRACMAMELITDPSIVFLDEPTSGLDTYTAYAVVKLLKDLAVSGRTVVATLHQPSSEIFHLIDDLCVMSQGEIMYHGAAAQAVSYFGSLGYKCPDYSNPADYIFMDVLNTVAATDEEVDPAKNTERLAGLLKSWKNSDTNVAMMKDIEAHSTGSKEGNTLLRNNFKFVSSFGTQCGVLFSRAFYQALRDKILVRAKLMQMTVISLIMGVIYLNIPARAASSQIQDRIGSLFFSNMFMVMSNAMGILSTFGAEKEVFQREFSAGYYGLPAYFLSKQIVQVPFQFVTPFIFSCIFYWMVGFYADAGNFFTYVVIAIALAGCGTAIGTLAACAFDQLGVALAIVPMILTPLMLFSGLFSNSGSIPPALDWIKYLSPMKYGFTAMFKNEFQALGQLCLSTINTPHGPVNVCIPTSSVITQFGQDDQGSVWMNFGVLAALWIILLSLSYLALWRVVSKVKRVDFPNAEQGSKRCGKA